ncbi:hypothetical protein [Nocardia sp. XZ_19_385]|uniref:hypothetical protein n=1 Tax=Nocardia sp. XZ_19_385 TaxID=2769488 RepID=UPI00188E1FCE|nr:hypothetical protein [Nocardia sp. XZ_19_385]
MAVPDIGQRRARELYAAATGSGGDRFELAPEVAQNLAAACDKLIEDLRKATATGDLVTGVTGFPLLPSGQALTKGFGNKGREFLDTVTAFQETALLFKAAYLAAGHRLAEADAANKAALQLISDYLDPR